MSVPGSRLRPVMAWAAAVLLALTGAAAPARASETPTPGRLDPRIRTVFYNADDVVDLTGYFGFQTMIEFAADERIENVSIGDATAWQITPNKKATLLFIKPLDVAAPTNMTVVTDLRRYSFELRARRTRRGEPADLAYVVRFTYPATHKTVTAATAAAAAGPPPIPPPERRNTAYSYTGSRAALPSAVFDDGRFTYFKWPDNTSTPALFLKGEDGGESLVNYSVRDGYQVVQQTAPRFVLRDGKQVTVIINDAWRPPAVGPQAPTPHDAKTAREAARAGVHR